MFCRKSMLFGKICICRNTKMLCFLFYRRILRIIGMTLYLLKKCKIY